MMPMPTKTGYRYIVRLNGVCDGPPVIKGTRTPVRSVVAYYKQGLSVEEILDADLVNQLYWLQGFK